MEKEKILEEFKACHREFKNALAEMEKQQAAMKRGIASFRFSSRIKVMRDIVEKYEKALPNVSRYESCLHLKDVHSSFQSLREKLDTYIDKIREWHPPLGTSILYGNKALRILDQILLEY